jgi:hypothetical protein
MKSKKNSIQYEDDQLYDFSKDYKRLSYIDGVIEKLCPDCKGTGKGRTKVAECQYCDGLGIIYLNGYGG